VVLGLIEEDFGDLNSRENNAGVNPRYQAKKIVGKIYKCSSGML